MMRLYDYTLSGSCYKVRLLLDFMGLRHERVALDFHPGRDHKKPEFLTINPLGQLPVLEDGGLRLRDAQAILAYLVKRHAAGGPWALDDPEVYGQVMMWLAFAGSEMSPISAARLHDVMGYSLDVDAARKAGHRALTVLDDHLTEREITGATWIVGNSPTIADIACFPYAALSGDGGIGHERYPALRNWLRAFRRLDGFKAMPGIPEFA